MLKLQAELLNELYPNLDEVKAEHGPMLKILSINAINPAKKAMAEVKKYKMDFQVLEGRGSGITKEYQVSKLPLLVIIDKDGIIRTYTMYLKYDELKEAVIPWVKNITEH
ncbi:MAG: redoxin domain-containing protein [FCB group bacterium]|nr:redoxin domain-containing protein [FCB group bacterium]